MIYNIAMGDMEIRTGRSVLLKETSGHVEMQHVPEGQECIRHVQLQAYV